MADHVWTDGEGRVVMCESGCGVPATTAARWHSNIDGSVAAEPELVCDHCTVVNDFGGQYVPEPDTKVPYQREQL